jgi:hypothetical protein
MWSYGEAFTQHTARVLGYGEAPNVFSFMDEGRYRLVLG